MRRRDVHFPARAQKTVKFFHGADHVGYVLDDVDCAHADRKQASANG